MRAQEGLLSLHNLCNIRALRMLVELKDGNKPFRIGVVQATLLVKTREVGNNTGLFPLYFRIASLKCQQFSSGSQFSSLGTERNYRKAAAFCTVPQTAGISCMDLFGIPTSRHSQFQWLSGWCQRSTKAVVVHVLSSARGEGGERRKAGFKLDLVSGFLEIDFLE